MRAVLLILIILTACNPSRKIQKAEQLVLTNPQSFDKLGKKWNELNPCANDTIGIVYPGGIDSIPYPVPVFDSVSFIAFADSLDSLCTQEAKQAYLNGYNAAVKKITSQKAVLKRPDTLLNIIVDRQKHKLYEDSIVKLNIKAAVLAQANGDSQAQLKKQKKETNKWLWLFIASLVVLTGTNGFWIYSKIKG